MFGPETQNSEFKNTLLHWTQKNNQNFSVVIRLQSDRTGKLSVVNCENNLITARVSLALSGLDSARISLHLCAKVSVSVKM